MNSPSIPQTLYGQVAIKIEKLIRSGALRPGDRLPSVRRACAQHNVSLTTAVQAYLSLENRGLIEARPKSGFFVCSKSWDQVQEPATSLVRQSVSSVGVGSLQAQVFDSVRKPDVVPLGAAYPGVENLPVQKLGRIMTAVVRRAGERGIGYDMPAPARSRCAGRVPGVRWIGAATFRPMRIITTCTAVLRRWRLCLRAVTKAGDVVVVEAPTYFGMLQQIEELGLKVLEIPMHPRDGMNLDALETALKKASRRRRLPGHA